MDKLVKLDVETRTVTVQPGLKKSALNAYLAKYGLFFPVDPGSDAGLGGYTSTGASGTLSVKYLTMRENVVSIRAVFPDGQIVTTRRNVVKSSVGYNLTQLLIGSEGTLAVIVEITLRVLPIPAHVLAVLARFPTLRDCADGMTLPPTP
jgi:D-lactate dehydrogenase (cytochrome)